MKSCPASKSTPAKAPSPFTSFPSLANLAFSGPTCSATVSPACPTSPTASSPRNLSAAIPAYGRAAKKDHWLPLLQSGKAIGCFGLTEPQFGSNPSGMLTRAVKKGNRYVLNGEKMWITNGSLADVALVWARCEDDKTRGFFIAKGSTGFKAWDVHGKLSLRASVTSGLAMNDCEISAENVLPGVAGLKGPLSCLTQARYGIGWGAIGAAMACYDTALQYSKTRKQFQNK